MSEDLSKIVPELDSLMIRTLELMEEQIKNKAEMEEIIKDGCLDLAKTRYIIGTNSVSSLQLPSEENEEIKALTTVVSSEETTSDGAHHTVFQLKIENLSKITDTVHNGDGVRQRKKDVTNKNEDNKESEPKSKENSNCEHKSAEIRQISRDPLKWFGVLVPQNLRRAQQTFQKALNMVAECASIQNDLMLTQQKFNVLYKLKQKLLEKDIS